MPDKYNSLFHAIMARLVRPCEGGLSMDKHDPGNWTGGKIGAGELKGTNTGISAASHPDLAVFSMDAAIQHGCRTAIRLLQRTVGVQDDGYWGPKTYAAVHNPPKYALVYFVAARLRYYADIPGNRYADGWMNRCAAAGELAARIATGT